MMQNIHELFILKAPGKRIIKDSLLQERVFV